jgi:hypothetical protein
MPPTPDPLALFHLEGGDLFGCLLNSFAGAGSTHAFTGLLSAFGCIG